MKLDDCDEFLIQEEDYQTFRVFFRVLEFQTLIDEFIHLLHLSICSYCVVFMHMNEITDSGFTYAAEIHTRKVKI